MIYKLIESMQEVRNIKTIFTTILTAMFGSAVSLEDDASWGDVFHEMKEQRIAGIVSDILTDMPMSSELKKEWRRYIVQQKLFYEELIATQNEVCKILNNIPYAVIKGTSAGMYYPNPNQRNMGDIDILFDGGTEEARDRLVEAGYLVNNVGGWRHIGLKKGRIDVELHYRYDKTVINDVAISTVKRAEKKCVDGVEFYALPKLENGLILLSHAGRHMQEGIGFRQVIDWMMFVADKEEIDWERFNEISQEAGFYKFQCVLTKLCVKYLGLPIRDDIRWCEDADDSICDKLLEFICKRGNFGMREGGYAGQFATKNKLIYGIRRLQLGGTYRWKVLIKYPWLKPFAWIYQLGRVAKEMASREKPIEMLKKDIKDSEDVVDLMDSLGLKIADAKDS